MAHARYGSFINVGNQDSPQAVYFGTEASAEDISQFVIPIEVLGGFFFLILALVMVGPGQEMGRAFTRLPNRVQAYTLNILGSIAGIVLFSLYSFWQLSPFWWFLPIVLLVGYFARGYWQRSDLLLQFVMLLLVVVASGLRTGTWHDNVPDLPWSAATSQPAEEIREHIWSPYYRIDYRHEPARGLRDITTNLISHQQMGSRTHPYPAYALPHLLRRDTGLPDAQDMMIIGAGSGNDVSRALQWGAENLHIDAVEIDPVIQRLGVREHPDQPYADKRVTVHIDDGRNYLRSTEKKYDLVIYALVDSLVLHSGYANLRLESFLFTQQAFADVKRCLKSGGMFIMYNAFRQGWIVARLKSALQETFGCEPLVLMMPYLPAVPEERYSGYTMFLVGDEAKKIREQFAKQPEYWVSRHSPVTRQSPNGFENPPEEERQKWRPKMQALTDSIVRQAAMIDNKAAPDDTSVPWHRFGLAQVPSFPEAATLASDDWPFLYLRERLVPDHVLRSLAIMGGIALVLLMVFWPRTAAAGPNGTNQTKSQPGAWGLRVRMFLLGAGFMLIETSAVVHMALLFGSTWMVNSIVFLAVLLMILVANLYVLAVRPRALWPYFVGLLIALGLNAAIPLDFFLGMDRTVQIAGSSLLIFTPVLFAAVIFAVSFSRTAAPDQALGVNIAGSMFGGFAENSSLLLGFQHLILVGALFYGLSWLFGNNRD
jgi:hypothetical protein